MTTEQAIKFQELINAFIDDNADNYKEWQDIKKSETPTTDTRSHKNHLASM
jgi:hypothetical protein